MKSSVRFWAILAGTACAGFRRNLGNGFFWLFLSFFLVLLPTDASSGELSVRVPYGGEITSDITHKLVYGAGWIQALRMAADNLKEYQSVRLAELDPVQRMALAALLDMFEVSFFESLSLLDNHGLPYSQPAGDSIAFISLSNPDEGVLNRSLTQEKQRQLYEEIILEINSLVEYGLGLTSEAAEQRSAMRLLEVRNQARPRIPILRSRPDYAPELEQICARLDACFSYLELFKDEPDWLNRQDAEKIIDQCLSLDPACLPFLIAKAQLLIHQDRAVTAMRLLSGIELPELNLSADEIKNDLAFAQSAFRVTENLQARFLQARSLALLGSAEPSMAEADLSRALDMRPDQADLWLYRGAVRLVLQDYENMCLDYYQACRMGNCLGLSTARDIGHCQNQNQ